MYRPDRFGRTDNGNVESRQEMRKSHCGERGIGQSPETRPVDRRALHACFAVLLASALALAMRLLLAAGALWWIASLGPVPLGNTLEFSTPCSTATDICCAPMPPRTAAGACRHRRRRRSALFRRAVRLRGQALPQPSRRRSAGACARRISARGQRPHSLRRLDAHHAGGAPARAAPANAPFRRSFARSCARSRSSAC